MTSDRPDWRTPRGLFDAMDTVFKFDLDAAADAGNHLCPEFFDLSRSAFDHQWADFGKSVWLNPPYGRGIDKWIDRLIDQSSAVDAAVSVVALVPARTDARWFLRLWEAADHMLFIRGRLRFDDGKNSAPFPSAIAVVNRGLSVSEKGFLMQWGKLI